MYPGLQARIRPQQPAFIMAQSGETVTYAELERRSSRLAHFLRANGLGRLDHYAIFMENHARYVECCSAGECVGLYYVCISSYLTPAAGSWLAHPDTSRLHPTARGSAAPHAERFADAELHYRRRAQRTRRNDTMEEERLLAFTDAVITEIPKAFDLRARSRSGRAGGGRSPAGNERAGCCAAPARHRSPPRRSSP